MGSLSALSYEARGNRWVTVSDDGRVPRLIRLRVGLGQPMTVASDTATRLSLAPGLAADTLTALDMEGLAAFPDGSFAVSHEGHIDDDGVHRQPRVLVAAPDGVVTAVIEPRPHFTMGPAESMRGVRHNLGLESLTRTPDGRLISGLEQPLAQDGPVTSSTSGGLVRLVEFVRRAGGTWGAGREWPYRLEPTPAEPGYGPACKDGDNGLSELLALTDTTLLAVERACLVGAAGAHAFNPIKLFVLTLDGADDVSGMPSLAGQTPALVQKRLVLDLAAWRAQLPAALAAGENIEGLAWGPPGPNGERTVMLVSDDNYRATQNTAFIWIALR